ncbi:hypothetical protein RFI_06601 [Reticulomyxa filosa]|uniref:Uncharacterized protein n=1 Tax=Reticulomyxa filosa TaxID=46433 RepID=X6NXH1_RETFI|nr:hypothetical protein RFI_06601 [Reticulomyxa filosa]|eukprot:ETO30519.1 hypothetical protein RFI_06601 [Reticulomyxa filosa]
MQGINAAVKYIRDFVQLNHELPDPNRLAHDCGISIEHASMLVLELQNNPDKELLMLYKDNSVLEWAKEQISQNQRIEASQIQKKFGFCDVLTKMAWLQVCPSFFFFKEREIMYWAKQQVMHYCIDAFYDTEMVHKGDVTSHTIRETFGIGWHKCQRIITNRKQGKPSWYIDPDRSDDRRAQETSLHTLPHIKEVIIAPRNADELFPDPKTSRKNKNENKKDRSSNSDSNNSKNKRSAKLTKKDR